MTRFLSVLPLSALLVLGLALSAMPRPADAQQQRCAPRPQMLLLLEERRSETRRAIGLTSAATVMELYASETGSWTLVVTMPSGLTCQVASGSDFESLEAALAGAPV